MDKQEFLKLPNTIKSLMKFVLIAGSQVIIAQGESNIKWWNPIDSNYRVVSGQGWPGEVESIYHRLPSRAKSKVRKEVWSLSKHSAGLSIKFRTNADTIKIRYHLNGELNYDLIPSSGVSGLDLYTKTPNGEWARCWGDYIIDSISTFSFEIDSRSIKENERGQEYQLLLPTFNEIDLLKIGVNQKYFFRPLPLSSKKPIVTYGTSICQGANASRPGMTWANMLERRLERPLINLGFSGNGKLEPELIELLTEIDAKLYVLDCLPNLTPDKDNVLGLITKSVKKIRSIRKDVPIILTAHPGFANEETSIKNRVHSARLNEELYLAYQTLKREGYVNLYLIKKKKLKFTIDSYADYGHPNDHGMVQYATAYEKLIKKVLSKYSEN
ncbi:SGNH/GDSL hydrolase family protein [Flagellimonas sp.]|uniref:SGNH/GDSL hydrolase family protein n=1 Tax=Flagellimonas sp. TaxID=2058762 RepID=UPI003BB19875